ncbi:hypothetical protein HHL25_05805 [Rhizobium sp. S-51]|uniref:Uncharacterized protein n=1 Tax=Rhizobium terricola TaxID=2728849 RepID=A0A7Y0AUF0_9HYPH|nr:hypothetical protein [Rhizobium terricola]NML73639.1 hypothetical protein [Rhizobium terricola]
MAAEPTLLEAMIAARKLGYKQRGFISIFPIRIILLILIPSSFVLYATEPDEFMLPDGGTISVLSAMLVVYGFFGAATVAALTQINEIATRFPFSDFLKQQNVFSIYTALPQYVFIVEIFSIILCCGLIIATSFCGDRINIYVVLISSGTTVYCCLVTIDLLNVIRGLSHHFSEYQKILHEESKTL